MAYPVTDAGDVGEGRLFLNATSDLAVGEQGLADGMAIDVEGRGADNNILYMTSASFLARVPTLTQGHIANINE